MAQMTPLGGPTRSEVLAFQRWLKCCIASKSMGPEAHQMYLQRFPHSEHHKAFEVREIDTALRKAATTPMMAANSPLTDYERLASSWLSHIYPRTVLGRMTGARTAPMGVSFPRVSGGASGFGWVGEGQLIRVSALGFDLAKMARLVVAGIAVVSDELARSSAPNAERLVADDMENSAIAALDRAFLDPTIAPVADISPGSITHGVNAIQNASPTSTARAFEDAFAAISTDFISPFVIMRPKTALALIVQGGADRLYPDLRVNGGSIWGVPALVSSSAPANTATVIDASLLLTGRDVPFFDIARHASVEMDDNPDGTGTRVNLWQSNMTGLRMRIAANWEMGQPGGVSVIENLPELGVAA